MGTKNEEETTICTAADLGRCDSSEDRHIDARAGGEYRLRNECRRRHSAVPVLSCRLVRQGAAAAMRAGTAPQAGERMVCVRVWNDTTA